MTSNTSAKNKIGITVALTGAITSSSDNKALPVTEESIVRNTVECYYAGASIVHLHIRDKVEAPSINYHRYKSLLSKIHESVQIITCISTSSYGVSVSDKERLKLLDLSADMASLTFGNIYRSRGKNTNSDYFIEASLYKMYCRNIIPEIEIFNEQMLDRCINYCEKKRYNPFVQLIFGAEGGMDAEMRTAVQLISQIPVEYKWSAAAVGKQQLAINLFSLLSGATVVRTGFEDNVFYRRGILATSNAQLVNRLKGIISELQYELYMPHELLRILRK